MKINHRVVIIHLLLSWALLLPPALSSQTISVASPDKRIEVKCHVENGMATYEVLFRNKTIIRPSRLGFQMDKETVGQSFYALGDSVKDIGAPKTTDLTWKPLYGETSDIEDHYNQIAIPLVQMHPPVYVCYLVLRVYNDGMAFRYNFPEQD